MTLLSDVFHRDKLKKNNINIETKYIVGSDILVRNTNNNRNDDIADGIRCEKKYYLGDKLLHKENVFDSRIHYTFITGTNLDSEYRCPNCGVSGIIKDFSTGCPYCGTYYNIDYVEKDLGGKHQYDLVVRSTKYRVITAIIDIVISFLIALIIVLNTSNTFNEYDIGRLVIYGLLISIALYYFFYLLDGYVILWPIKYYKHLQNQKQKEFWKRTKLDKKVFFNNFNYEVRKMFYSTGDIIDYDVLDFLEFKEYIVNDILHVKVKADIRLVYYKNYKIISKYTTHEFVMKKVNNNILELSKGLNIMECKNCGASIDATKGKCEYCDTEIGALQEWVLEK